LAVNQFESWFSAIIIETTTKSFRVLTTPKSAVSRLLLQILVAFSYIFLYIYVEIFNELFAPVAQVDRALASGARCVGSSPAGGTFHSLQVLILGGSIMVETGDKSSSKPESEIGEDEKILAVMAYIPAICLIPLMQRERSAFVASHARLGFALFLVEIIAVLLRFRLIWDAIIFLCVFFAFLGIYQALRGKEYNLPFLSDLFHRRW
jgi:uncharacterized membrane protein